MKISKLFNENKIFAKTFYFVFKTYHFFNSGYRSQKEFKFLGDLPPKLYVPFHPNPESNLYGHIEVLKKYINDSGKLFNVHIQHGVILGNLVQDIMKESFASTIVTYSDKRKEIIEKATGKRAVAIGPYIKYAQNRLSKEKFDAIKKELGKTLLVFPAHSSVDRTQVNFDQLSLIKKINSVKKSHGINTVFVNLFYADCTKEAIEFYENEGFKVCSAGYWLSGNFVSNLRTIIELSDFTMSNRMGTHIGYCISLGKPHFVFKQDHSEDFIGTKGIEDLQQVTENEHLTDLDIERVESAFLEEKFEITDEQLAIVREYWGNNFYTPDELNSLLS
jgi:hypothetical protein